MTSFTVIPRGPFTLRESALFGFGYRTAPAYDGTMRMAFGLDDFTGYVGAAVTQDAAGVHLDIVDADGAAPPAHVAAAARDQLVRVLSLDHDGDVFTEIGRRDPVIGRLQALAPGLRPPQFYSPYDAACWAVLSARRSAMQMSRVRDQIAARYGTVIEVSGVPIPAWPTPQHLLTMPSFPGLPEVTITRLHAIARAALDGELDVLRLRTEDPQQAMDRMQRLPGIGPFYGALIVIRSTGRVDVLPDNEPRGLAIAGELYGLGRPATPAELRDLGRNWEPMPTWALVLIRAAGQRLLAEQPLPA